jgi:integrase
MRKDQVDFVNATVWIPDSKTPNGVAEIPLTPLAVEALKSQMRISGTGPFLFPSDKNPSGHHKNLKTAWRKTLKRAGIPYFRIYDLRSTYATRLSAGGVADEWVTQLLLRGHCKTGHTGSLQKRPTEGSRNLDVVLCHPLFGQV